MPTTPQETVLWYVNDLIAAHRHTLEAVRRHERDDDLHVVPGAHAAVSALAAGLERHIALLESRAQAMGGQGVVGNLKEALTTVTGTLTGLYGAVRSETPSRMLRDDATAANFLMTCTTMLYATARALGDNTTAGAAEDIMKRFPPLIMELQGVLPEAVVIDVSKDHPGANPAADEETVRQVKIAWRSASTTKV
jgi:hypothetical protein